VTHLYKLYVSLRARYSFYGIRDELIQLVADGYLDENDKLFIIFYRWSNSLAKDARSLNFKLLVSALAEKEPSDPEIKALFDKVETANDNVKLVISRFSCAIADTIMNSSLLVRLLVVFIDVSQFIAISFKSKREQRIPNRYKEVDFCKKADTAISWKNQSNRLVAHQALA
jgi:hypothetical protein